MLWKQLIREQGGEVTPALDLSSLAKISDGYTPGHMVQMISGVLSEHRLLQQATRPLTAAVQVRPGVPGRGGGPQSRVQTLVLLYVLVLLLNLSFCYCVWIAVLAWVGDLMRLKLLVPRTDVMVLRTGVKLFLMLCWFLELVCEDPTGETASEGCDRKGGRGGACEEGRQEEGKEISRTCSLWHRAKK